MKRKFRRVLFATFYLLVEKIIGPLEQIFADSSRDSDVQGKLRGICGFHLPQFKFLRNYTSVLRLNHDIIRGLEAGPSQISNTPIMLPCRENDV